MAMSQEQPPQPAQEQGRQPGLQEEMTPPPATTRPQHRGSGRLQRKAALITGGDSGIGRAVAVLFAREGADVAIVYKDEHADAQETVRLVEKEGGRCLAIAGDVGDEGFCREAVRQAVDELGGLDILVNNAAEQHMVEDVTELTAEQVERTFRTNIYSQFFMTKAAVPHLGEGSAIVNTTSITAYQGNPVLVDYSATKGAIVAFTRALSQQLVGKGIRVNAVAPGPIWTPLVVMSFPAEKNAEFGADTPLGRPGQPGELAPLYVFLATDDSGYISGEVIGATGGKPLH
jgi:NAD(P)-dependent dehydrogenase (short-subunit alcohol dehydrogenase family)